MSRLRFAIRPAFAVPPVADRGLLARLCLGHAVVFAAGIALSWGACGRTPFRHPAPWLTLQPVVAASSSAAIGVAFAFALSIAARAMVTRFSHARALHAELRPLARALSPAQVVLVSAFAGIAEETFFRGFLVPIVGVGIASILFGLAHRLKGSVRWLWVLWSTVGGFAFGIAFALTGSLLGAVLGHVLANAASLLFLREHDPEAAAP